MTLVTKTPPVNTALIVSPVTPDTYTVLSGRNTYTVDTSVSPPSCDCDAYRYLPRSRPCKHGRAVLQYRAEPQAGILDALDDEQTLDVIDPSKGNNNHPRVERTVDAHDRKVALAALMQWEKLFRAKQPVPRWLYRVACAVKNGLEHEQQAPSIAAEYFAKVREYIERQAVKGVA